MESRSHKRFITFILIVALFLHLFTVTSCNRRYDENEVAEATAVLLQKAEMLNSVYFGEGIKYYDEENAIGHYRKAQKSHLDELGFHTIDELKALTEETFSTEYSNIIYSTVLSALMSDGTLVNATRYYQAYDEKSGEPTDIMVHSNFTPLMKGSVTYDYSSISVMNAKKEKVFAKVNAIVTNKDGASQNIEIVITLIEEEKGWRIDNPTYANYSEKR